MGGGTCCWKHVASLKLTASWHLKNWPFSPKKERIIFQASDFQGANMSCSFQGGVYMEETREVRLGLEGYEIFATRVGGLPGDLPPFL